MSQLEIDSVLKYYDERSILTDIYLKLDTGEIIGLLGRNGSGKSTLLEIIFGSKPADKFLKIDKVIYESPYKENGLISYLPQHNFIPGNLTVKKAAQLYLKKQEVQTFLNDELLTPIQHTKISGVSGGELRYLEVKLLMHLNSKFVLLDEPFNGVSPVMIEKIKALIQQGSKTKGIILTDHDYDNVMDITSKNYLLFQGSLKAISNKQDLANWGYISGSKL